MANATRRSHDDVCVKNRTTLFFASTPSLKMTHSNKHTHTYNMDLHVEVDVYMHATDSISLFHAKSTIFMYSLSKTTLKDDDIATARDS